MGVPVHPPKAKAVQLLSRLLVVAAVLVIAYATLRPWGGTVGSLCVRCGESWLGDALLNVVLFVPLGLALGAAGASTRRAAWISASFSLVIEILQYTLVSGRFSSPLDVLTNTTGGWLGSIGYGVVVAWLRADAGLAGVATFFAALWWIQCFTTAWGLRPWIPTGASYEGQWARVFPGFAPFAGRVLDAHLFSIVIPDGAVADSGKIRRQVQDSLLEFRVRTQGLPRADPIALVAALANGPAHRVASLSLAGCRLQARSGTNSERIGFNTPRVAVENACVPPETVATIVLRQDGRQFTVERSAIGEGTVRGSLALRPDIGWVMLAPLVTSASRRQLVTYGWIALFAFPVGLLSGRRRRVVHVAGFLLLMLAGTVLPALIFQTAYASPAELAALAGSLMAGATVASAIPRWPRRASQSPE